MNDLEENCWKMARTCENQNENLQYILYIILSYLYYQERFFI